MRLRFATRLFLIPATAALAFVLVIAVSVATSRQLNEHIDAIEARYVPKIELGPKLVAGLSRVREGLQAAVAAQDLDQLAELHGEVQTLLDDLDAGQAVIAPADLATARVAVSAYFDAGHALSRRIIAGETGEPVVDAMRALQVAHDRAAVALDRAARVDRGVLGAAFESLRDAGGRSRRLVLAIAASCTGLVLLLALALGRGMAESLAELSAGFERFGEGDFTREMRVLSSDELGDAARGANAMAAKLRQAQEQRRVAEWIRTSHAGLALELTGDHEPADTARHVVSFVARRLDALAGALYTSEADGTLVRVATYAHLEPKGTTPVRFAPGEGLVGEAALRDDITTLAADDSAPAFELVHAGLGQIRPRALALVPVRDGDATIAVLEFALPHPLADGGRELLTTLRRTVAIGLLAARTQAARNALLSETQLQAARLAEQEERLSRSNLQLEAQQSELQAAVEELRQQTAELDSFSYSVSHDLRAPLRAIDGFTRILLEDHGEALDEDGKRVANIIRSNTQKMGRLIDDLLAFSRLGRQAVVSAPIDMDALAREAFAEAAESEPRRSIELIVHAPLPQATGDASLVRQVWSNLLANAVKYTRPRAHAVIELSATRTADLAQYTVRDNGVGFDMAYVHKLFGVFQRLHGPSEFEGTGVGLALVHRVIKKHGGDVTAEGVQDGGASFSFTLPASATDATSEE